MTAPVHDERQVASIVDRIVHGFRNYRSRFRAITRRAETWFENRDWAALQRGIVQRIELYGAATDRVRDDIEQLLHGRAPDRGLWVRIKAAYADAIAHSDDEDLAETFFNSITRILLGTVGVDRQVEFVWFEPEVQLTGAESPIFEAYHRTGSADALIEKILQSLPMSVPWEDCPRDARRIARTVESHLGHIWGSRDFDAIELVEPVFYRSKAAYIVGRLRRANRLIPFILPILNGENGLFVDTVLLTEDDAHSLFSLTRNYFFVESHRPGEIIGFLRSILPAKPVAELYISLGHIKHGKTVLFRDLHRHLRYSTDRFELTKGTKGMVMVVFTLPSYHLVFKVIRDSFDAPKDTTAEKVKSRYELVSRHDRVGRLIDTQEFENLTLRTDRFDPEVIEELKQKADRTVRIGEHEIVFEHVYIETRLEPLDVYVQEASADRAEAAVIDYGQAVKDLAAANIFCGDLLIKNFGVTWHGRVVFYDYDEISLLEECKFRPIPKPRDDLDDFAAEPTFYVGPNDVFPEEFSRFLLPDPRLREVFWEHHADVFTVEFWRENQRRLARGEYIDFFPYDPSKRFGHRVTDEAL